MKACDGLHFTWITSLFQALPCAICPSHRDTNQSREITSTRGNIFYQYYPNHIMLGRKCKTNGSIISLTPSSNGSLEM